MQAADLAHYGFAGDNVTQVNDLGNGDDGPAPGGDPECGESGGQPDPVGGTTGEGGACDVTATPSDCVLDLSCQRTAADSKSGICHAAGGKENYQPCTKDDECKSLFCAPDVTANGATRCQTPCDPSNNKCGTGMGCAAINTEVGGCYLTAAVAGGTGGASDGGSGTSSGCSAGAIGTWSGWFGLLLAAGLVTWRRRRSA